ncbi:DUF5358 domain-containing protein [Otariodibacter oris]|uniref:Uncharacterized protein n=1 Tax=Otariodibacter oris TaxID=1032623 RepID=A0A420XEW7_9PAST|nr:DUF5358 domain-containing protein [Otariodibacter oris]QGM81364.1 hypothetical protein A6A10_08045 [Otariodibacter oris]RKR70824.1 hypothetical protein DES31_1834 [Otariodibacter oris]
MLKKIVISTLCLGTVVACTSQPVEQPFPGEFIGADYILLDKDAKQWTMVSRQVEECIYPNLTRIQQEHFAPEDAYIHAQYVLFYPLEDIIGEDYVKMIQNDSKSMGYAKYQFKKYKTTMVPDLDMEQCKILREKAKNDLAVLKGEYLSGMAEDKQEQPSPSNDVATDNNKFFFDIIKWGSALLL